MDPSGSALAAAEEAVRRGHLAAEVLARTHAPPLAASEWRGPAAAAAAGSIHDLGRRIAVCRLATEEYLAAARRAVHDA